MKKAEQKMLEFISKHIDFVVIVAISVLGALVRYSLRTYISGDMNSFLLPWYDEIKPLGLKALSKQVGDYNIMYQFLIAVMTYIPINAVAGYKILSIGFDYILAVVVAFIVYQITNHSKSKATWAYACVLMSPLVFLNSSCWGQCDVIYTTFLFLALLAMMKKRYNWMMVAFGISFAFKLQAVFLLPFFLFVYFMKREFSLLKFVIIPLTLLASGLPGVIAGRSIFDIFRIYMNQTSSYPKIQMNYPSAWCIVVNSELGDSDIFFSIKRVAILITISILLMLFYYWIRNKVEMTEYNLIYIAFLTCYTCVLFLPTMHERYGYTYEILAILIALIQKKSRVLLVGLLAITIVIYGNYLFGLGQPISQYFSFANLGVYFAYIYLLNKEMTQKVNANEEV